MLLSLLLGCTDTPATTLAECETPDCRHALAMSRWEAAPEAVAAEIAGLEDPVEQMALIQAISERSPGQVLTLCEALPVGDVRSQCTTLQQRPHLSVDPTVRDPNDRREGRGVFVDLVVGASLHAPLAQVAPITAPCPEGERPVSCQTETAKTIAQTGEVAQAAGYCLAISEEKWQNECLFQSADAAILIGKSARIAPHRVPGAVDLCLSSGPYTGLCFSHLYSTIARQAPSAGAEAAEWKTVIEATARAEQALAIQNPGLGQRLADRTWAEALWRSYLESERITGRPLAILPPAAHPHIRAAAAWRLVALSEPSAPLSVLLTDLETGLSQQGAVPSAPRTRLPEDLPVRWRGSRPTEASLPWVHYLDDMRRTVASDTRTDLTISLLEALARSSPPRTEPLIEALQHNDPLVRWTAARLLGSDPKHAALLAPLSGDDSALVRGRATP